MFIGIAVVVLTIVILYIATKDRWNWLKLVKRLVLFAVSIAVIGSVALYAYSKYKNAPKKIEKYWDVSFDDTREDVIFKKGKPTHESNYKGNGKNNGFLYIDEKTPVLHEIQFIDDKVKSIGCGSDKSYICDTIDGVGNDTLVEQLIDKCILEQTTGQIQLLHLKPHKSFVRVLLWMNTGGNGF